MRMPTRFCSLGGSANFGAFKCVITASTPGAFSAATESIEVIVPFEIVLVTKNAQARFGTLNSPAYVAEPVTFNGPSTRLSAVLIDLALIDALILVCLA